MSSSPASLEPKTEPHAAQAAETTRARLLDAAERLFAERGYSAASIRDITREAGTNVAAVNYHFGGKSALYFAMFERRLAELRGNRLEVIEQARASSPRVGLEELLERFATVFLQPLLADDRGRLWVQLYSREMLDPQLPPTTIFDEILQPTQEALARALCEIVPGLARETALLSVQSLIGQLLHVRNLQKVAEHAPRDARELYSIPRLFDHAVRFTAAAIRNSRPPETIRP